MKFSVLRSKKKNMLKNSEKLLKKISTLNPSGQFRLEEKNVNHICSDLSCEALSKLVIPVEATFVEDAKLTAREFGCLFVNYKKNEYVIYVKGLQGAIFLL